MPRSRYFVVCLCLAAYSPSTASARAAEKPEWKAGLASVSITPETPVVLLGYDGRVGPFTEVQAEIYAKALALEDAAGKRAVIVTADLVGFQRPVSEPMVKRILEKTGLKRSELLLNASHNHTGPLVSLAPLMSGDFRAGMSPDDAKKTVAYTRQLHDKIVDLVERALANLKPAKLSWSTGHAPFVMSRRLPTARGVVMKANPNGVTDRSVLVLRVDDRDGKLRGVLFGCACHNVALSVQNVISGDYAGYAQTLLEEKYPGATALFMIGCGADANPEPYGSTELAKKHGTTLGQEVCRVLESARTPIEGPLKTELGAVELPLQKLSRDQIETIAHDKNQYAVPVMARQMLRVLDRGAELPTSYETMVGVWQFGDALTLVALPAEPVAEYVTALAKALGPEKLWVAGYNNDCFGYLPTAKVVTEGGHESIGVTLFSWGEDLYRNVGFFTTDVEKLIVATTRGLAEKAGRKLPD